MIAVRPTTTRTAPALKLASPSQPGALSGSASPEAKQNGEAKRRRQERPGSSLGRRGHALGGRLEAIDGVEHLGVELAEDGDDLFELLARQHGDDDAHRPAGAGA